MKLMKNFKYMTTSMMLAGSVLISAVAMPAAAMAATKDIGEAKAKEIALADAGFSEKDVYFDRTETGTEKGAAVYEIEFKTKTEDYGYDVSVVDGEIVSYSWEMITPKDGGAAVSEEKAKDIALKDAGLASKDVTFDRIKNGTEDGVAVYEIEFNSKEKEYDYDITKNGGKIVSRAWEVKTPACVAAAEQAEKKTTTNKSARDTAIDTALAHAGLERSEVSGLKCEKDHDDGTEIYEVEFKHGGYEYSYDIDAKTFRILDWDKDIDD